MNEICDNSRINARKEGANSSFMLLAAFAAGWMHFYPSRFCAKNPAAAPPVLSIAAVMFWNVRIV